MYLGAHELETKFEDIPIHDLGNQITISGLILQGQGKTYGFMMPLADKADVDVVMMNHEAWEKFLFQVDTLEAVMFPNSTDPKLTKAIVRKSQRNIEAQTQWKVFHRDGYQCRYCGIGNGTPMTIDHIILWEDLGQSVEDNLITACRKCNKNRGNMPYEKWLESAFYAKVMGKWLGNNWADTEENTKNVLALLPAKVLPLRSQQRSR